MRELLLLTIPAFLFLLSGCGGDDDGTRTIDMELGVEYNVTIGDKIIQNEPNTIVEITHTQDANISYVILEQGSASIVTKN